MYKPLKQHMCASYYTAQIGQQTGMLLGSLQQYCTKSIVSEAMGMRFVEKNSATMWLA